MSKEEEKKNKKHSKQELQKEMKQELQEHRKWNDTEGESSISEGEMHILLTAFWATIYEPFIHGYRMEQIEAHSRRVCSAV